MNPFKQYFDVHVPDKVVPPRAVAVLPSILQIRKNCISPRRSLTQCIRFGPLQGVAVSILHSEATQLIKEYTASGIPIYLFGRTNDAVFYMDVTDKDKSNWLGLLPLGDQNTANVWLYEENQQIYGVTTKPIASRIPLALGYSKAYAKEHSLPLGLPVLDLDEVLNQRSLQKENSTSNVHHRKEMDLEIPMRRRYRCTQCRRTFSRLFTLKRHRLKFCTKQTENSTGYTQLETNLSAESSYLRNDQLTIEDNKVPSDESLQNYTNGLDFSTNLFDTDRIPNLDTSGSSRSEIELNSYASLFKDDNCLSNYLNFGNSSSKIDDQTQDKHKREEKILETCPQCDETIVKGSSRQHFREKHSLLLKCECGQIFNNRQKLAIHIHKEHSSKLLNTEPNSMESPHEMPYNCNECKHGFKRRGMLVNHMWRVHGVASAVPLERRVRHYPCAICPKVYGAAAKRDTHMRRHHPGVEGIRLAAMEGGRRVCEPAACTACPRQYATRAKLLQHIRAAHPNLAVPVKPRAKKKCTSKEEKCQRKNYTNEMNDLNTLDL